MAGMAGNLFRDLQEHAEQVEQVEQRNEAEDAGGAEGGPEVTEMDSLCLQCHKDVSSRAADLVTYVTRTVPLIRVGPKCCSRKSHSSAK